MKRDEDMTDEEVIAHIVRQGREMLERFLASMRDGNTLDEAFDATGRPREVRTVVAADVRELGPASLGVAWAPEILNAIWVYRTIDRKGAFALGHAKQQAFMRDGYVQMLGLVDSDFDKQ